MSSFDYLDFPLGETEKPQTIGDQLGKPEQSLFSLTGEVFSDVTLVGAAQRYMDRPDIIDQDFKLTPELMTKYAADIPVTFLDQLSKSKSLDEFIYRTKDIKERLETRSKLSQHGLKGTALTFGVAMFDPAFLGAGLIAAPLAVSGKVAQLGVTSNRAVRARAALRGAGLAAAVDLPLETLRTSIDDMTDMEDLFFNVAASATLGSGVGAAFPSTTGFSRNWRNIVQNEKNRLAAEIEGRALGTNVPAPGSSEDLAREAAEALDPSGALFNEIPKEAIDASDVEVKPSLLSSVIMKIPGFRAIAFKGAQSSNPNVRKTFRFAVESPEIEGPQDIETQVALNRRLAQIEYYQKKRAIQLSSGDKALRDIELNIAEAIRTGRQMQGQAGELQKAAQKAFSNTLDLAERAGVDVSGIVRDAKFLPREYNSQAFLANIDRFGEEEVERLLKEALQRGDPELSETKVLSRVKAVMKFAQDPDGYVNARLMGGKSAQKVTEIEKVLKSRNVDLEDIDEIIDLLMPKSSQPHLGMTNRRIKFDESYSITAVNKQTGRKETLKFNDLLENNVDQLLEKYTHRLVGATGLTRLGKQLGVETAGTGAVPSLDDFTRYMQKGGNVSQAELAYFEQFYRHVMGMPQKDLVELGDAGRKGLQLFKNANFINVMANVGIAQFAELATSIAATGVRAALLQMPDLRKLSRNLQTGKWNDELAAQIEEFIAPSEGILNNFSRNYEVDAGFGYQNGGIANRLVEPLRNLTAGTTGVDVAGRRIPINITGIAPMDDALRIGHSRSALQWFVNQAFKVKKSGKVVTDTAFDQSRSRFKDLGLNDQDVDKLMEILADTSNGVVATKQRIFGRKVVGFNHDKFPDKVLLSKLQFALARDLDRVIQRNKIGNKDYFLNTPSGGLVFQFRQFAANAGFKQLGYNLKRFDQTSVKTFAGTTMFGYLGYLANTYINANRYTGVDRREFLDEALGFHEFMDMEIPRPLLAGITRAGPAGMFPSFIDTASSIVTPEREAFFSPYFRTTGLGVGLLEGIPAVSYADDLLTTSKEVLRAGLFELTDGELGGKFTEKDLKTATRLFPLRNSLFINRPLQKLVEEADLPKRED